VTSTGDTKRDVETPSLCLDLSRFEANLTKLTTQIGSAGKAWRPHVDCHGSPQIALQQIQMGAVGLTCASISEAEFFARAGIRDLLISQLPVGTRRNQRIATLCLIADPIITCDHYAQAESLSAVCVRQGVTCRVLVEINLGTERSGVRPGRDAIELARAIQQLPQLQLCGIMGCEGPSAAHSDLIDDESNIDAALGILSHARHVFRKNELCCDIVSAGGTGSLSRVLACDAVTELQHGSLIFGDGCSTDRLSPARLEPALTLLTTLVSRPAFERAVLDAGRKSCWVESSPPTIRNGTDARISQVNSDHLVVSLGPSSVEWRIGDRVEIEVDSPQMTTLLHKEIHCFRQERLEAVWPIQGRGELA